MNFRYRKMFLVLGCFLLVAVLLLQERIGIAISEAAYVDPYLERAQVVQAEDAVAALPVSCLVLTDLGRADCAEVYTQFQRILLDLRVRHQAVDLGTEEAPRGFDGYETVVVLTPDASALGEGLVALCDWVKAGGRAMFAMPMEDGAYTSYLQQKIGVLVSGNFELVDSVWFDGNFLLGGGQSYGIMDGFESARSVQLRDEARVFARLGGESGLPLIWSQEYGEGRFVVDNLGLYGINTRGIYAASYSLLQDVFAYPVLNGAVIFLDDMPSPVPMGNSSFIDRDYGISVAEFYTNVWFPDIQDLCRKYDLPMVGLVIENYENVTDGTVTEQTDTIRFSYFGNLILRGGGELGYHGFNHQPLCLGNTDYAGEYDYKTWQDTAAMSKGLWELERFCAQLYPSAVFSLYVPPSNIMSQEGRALIGSLYPRVRTVSGIYLPDNTDLPYVQEFGVAGDGIVELPRITSGSLLDDYTRLAALSELNYHYVFSHFIHPDDAMDPDRGAEMGWEALYENLSGFFDWLFTAAPSIRPVDSAQLSGAIQRWEGLTVRQTWGEHSLTLDLDNYQGEGWLFLRLNLPAAPNVLENCRLTNLTGNLYLLEANAAQVTLEWK